MSATLDVRRQLLIAGFSPIPLQGKLPVLKEWQKKFETNDGEIELWEKVYPHAVNTGFLTRHTPTIDIDITDEPAARAVEDLIREKYEERGFLLVRFGRRPKRAIPFRTNDPFRKIICSLISPDGKREKIELLGDGQQLACFGLHPDTNQPYEWFGGLPGQIAQADLPYISAEEAREFVEAAGKLLIAEYGYKPIDGQHPEAGPTLTGDGKAANWDQLVTNIIVGVELHDLIVQLSASFAAKGFPPGDVSRLLKSLLASSDLPHDHRWQERFDDIDRTVKTAFAKYQPTTVVGKLIQTSAEFIADFVPPDYLIDGLIQRRFLYGLTGPTNAGKTSTGLRLAAHVGTGQPLGKREVARGKVLFFAGDNPDDVRMRWTAQCEERGLERAMENVFFIPGRLSISALRERINAETNQCGPFNLIIIDSASAFFEGDDENSNTQHGNYARMLRTLVTISGGPSIVVLCHPIKNYDLQNLLPRGGGAFLNELDFNLVLVPVSETPKISELHWQAKHRGPDFAPVTFKLTTVTSDQIKDSKGRLISTVTAAPLTRGEVDAAESTGTHRQGNCLPPCTPTRGRHWQSWRKPVAGPTPAGNRIKVSCSAPWPISRRRSWSGSRTRTGNRSRRTKNGRKTREKTAIRF